jgi:hypothetical protein
VSQGIDWLKKTVDILQAEKKRGLPATELALVARDHLGEAFNSVTFMAAFRQAFNIPLKVMQDAVLWKEFHAGPQAMSDEEFEQLLSSWI